MMLGTNPNRGLADMVATRLNEYCPGLAGKGAVLQELLAYPLSQLERKPSLGAFSVDVAATWRTNQPLFKAVEDL